MKRISLSVLLFVPALVAQVADTAKRVPEVTFPPFANGDGRQKLTEFAGQPVLLITFADVWGGTAAIDIATDLCAQHGKKGLIVIMTHIPSGGTFGDGARDVDLGAWAMRRYPGLPAMVCGDLDRQWNWSGLEMPPYYAVIGADGALVQRGNLMKGGKEMETAVAAAMKQYTSGWGTKEEAAVRARCANGDFAGARAAAPSAMQGEIDTLFQRRVKTVQWLLDDGQWLRAKDEAALLVDNGKDVEPWQEALTALQSRLATDAAKQELDLDAKLRKLVKPLATKSPEKDLPRRLRDFAKKAGSTSVGARAERMAAVVDQALLIK